VRLRPRLLHRITPPGRSRTRPDHRHQPWAAATGRRRRVGRDQHQQCRRNPRHQPVCREYAVEEDGRETGPAGGARRCSARARGDGRRRKAAPPRRRLAPPAPRSLNWTEPEKRLITAALGKGRIKDIADTLGAPPADAGTRLPVLAAKLHHHGKWETLANSTGCPLPAVSRHTPSSPGEITDQLQRDEPYGTVIPLSDPDEDGSGLPRDRAARRPRESLT